MNQASNQPLRRGPLLTSGIFLGIGMGGFLDGILFHQIFQLHNMLSHQLFPDTLVNMEINMVWDGLFHAFTWIMTAFGIGFLWRAGKHRDIFWSSRSLLGALALGWGLFNLVEGIINHHLFEIHHVVERAQGISQLYYDLAFLASGVLLIGMGYLMIHGDRKSALKESANFHRAA